MRVGRKVGPGREGGRSDTWGGRDQTNHSWARQRETMPHHLARVGEWMHPSVHVCG